MKILEQPGLEIAIPSTLKHETTSYVMITRGTKLHDHKAELRPSTELLFSTSEIRRERILRGRIQQIAKRKLVLTMLQVDMATRKLVQTISAVLPVVLCLKRLPFQRTKGSGQLFPPILRTEELCRYRSPNWLQGWYVITITKNENKMDHIIGTP